VIIGPCTVVTGGLKPAVLEDAGVRVAGAHIAQVGPVGSLAASYPDDTLWPARGRVLLPGFVNTHVHLTRHLARGLRLGGEREWQRYEKALAPEDVRWAATAALVEGVRHGITTLCDFHRSASCLELSLSETLDAARAVGVRVATCYGAAESDAPEERQAAVRESVGFAADLAKKREGRLRALLGVQARTLSGLDTLIEQTLEMAGDDLALHVDLALDLTPAERWKRGARWPETTLPSLWAHADAAPKGLIAAARDRDDVLSVTGAGSAASLLREVDVAWGSDAGPNAPPLPDPTHVWSLAAGAETHYRRLFVHGAAWASRHFGQKLGEIAPGSPADVILVDYRPATEFSTRTLLDHLWAGLLRAPVAGAMVAGEVIMENGVLVSIDEREVAARARECAKRVWEALG
jgi:cytosine/adenosine deaminase-related metal-dependent hydrolase